MEKASGLEVDSRQHGLHLPQAADEPHYKPLEPDFAGDSGEYLHQHQRARAPRKIFGLRRTTFTLSTILAIVLILGIVSAISAGTCASKNGGYVTLLLLQWHGTQHGLTNSIAIRADSPVRTLQA